MNKKKKNNPASSDSEYALVYSTDPLPEKYCPACSRPISGCVCKSNALASVGKLRPAVRIEKKGRGGKTVTLVSKLPPHETFLKELLGYLKRSLGCGGTSYINDGQGIIELQGERQNEVLDLIAKYK